MARSRPPVEFAWALVAGFALAMVLPIAATPFLGDDIFNSYINGVIGWSGHTSFLAFFKDLNAHWIRVGRFFPGALIESYGLFHIVSSLAIYKTFQVLITLLNVWTFYLLLREFRIARTVAQVGVVLLICAFQMRVYHDGLLGFSGYIEFIAELAMLSVLGVLRFVRQGTHWALVASLVLYAIGLLTYEATYLFWLVILAVLNVELPRLRALRLVAPYFAMSVVVVSIQLYVKSSSHMGVDANYNIGWNLGAFIVTLAKQMFAAVPLTYTLIDPSNMFGHGAFVFGNLPIWLITAIFAVASTAVWTLGTHIDRSTIDLTSVRMTASVGLALWITPAVLVASSVLYQRELVFGLGHVPVYIEYYGVSMIALATAAYAMKRWGVSRRVLLIGSLAVGAAASVMYASNVDVIATHAPDGESISNMNDALASGLMHDVPEGSNLFVDSTIAPNRYLDGSPADAKYYYFFKTGKHFVVHFLGELPKVARCAGECPLPVNSFELINVSIGLRSGFDALGHLRAISGVHGEIHSFASDVSIFVRGVPSRSALALQYTEHGCEHADRVVTRTLSPRSNGTILDRFASACGFIEMDTISIAADVAVR